MCKQRAKSWFNYNIKNPIQKRDKSYAKWKRYKTENFYNEFKSNRKLVNETIAEAKRNYYILKFQHSKNNKNTWTILRELGIGHIKLTLSCDTDLDDLNHKFLQSTVPEFTNNTYLTSLESCDRNNCDIIIPVTLRVKGYTRFVGKYVTGRRKRFRTHKVYIFLTRITSRVRLSVCLSGWTLRSR